MSHQGMVYALRESHRVLKPSGLLIDLRPAAIHRRVGFLERGEYRLPWVMRERFDDDRAADRAIAQVVAEGLFHGGRRTRFPCFRVMDTIEEFKAWLTDFVSRDKLPPHEWLVRLIQDAFQTAPDGTQIVVSGPLTMQVLVRTCQNREQ